MSESESVSAHIKELMSDICVVLNYHGHTTVSAGALMRVIGIASDQAQAHDDVMIDISQALLERTAAPEGVTIH